MACNDYQGHLILDVCRSQSILVPEEIAVLGVDNDTLVCELCDPELSSVIPDTYRTGYEAAELLERMMNREQLDGQTRLITQPLGVRLRASSDIIAIQDQEVRKSLELYPSACIEQHSSARRVEPSYDLTAARWNTGSSSSLDIHLTKRSTACVYFASNNF